MVNSELKRYEQAIAEFYRCLSISPEFAAAKLQLGYLYEITGDTGMAVNFLEDFIRTAPLIYNDDIARAKERLGRLRR